MTYEQAIRNLPLRDFASIVLRRKFIEDIDYDWEENPFSWGYKIYYVTLDGLEFDEYDYEAALDHECWCLQREAMVPVKIIDSEVITH